jgi:hypothetical protein
VIAVMWWMPSSFISRRPSVESKTACLRNYIR